MAQRTGRDEEQGSRKEAREDGSSIAESIRQIAAYNARAELNNEKQLLLFLKSWWSRTYNRPLKDPLLESYTLAELLYEFYDKIEREKAIKEQQEQEADKVEEKKEQEALDWAEQEEKKELEAMKAQQQQTQPKADPTKDPENIAWMEEQIRKAKEVYGDSFGEDIEENF